MFLPDRWPTALVSRVYERGSIAVAVRTGFGVERFIRTDVRDNPGALVGESCEG